MTEATVEVSAGRRKTVDTASRPAGTKRPVRRERRSRAELSAQIVSAATQLFAEQGFHGPTVREIADAAGVALPALYRLFVDKRDLYVKCCELALLERREMLESFYDPSDSDEMVLFGMLHLGLVINANSRYKHTLISRIVFEAEDEVLKRDDLAQTPAIVRTRQIGARLSDAQTGPMRLMLSQAFYEQYPHILMLFAPGDRPDANDVEGIVVSILNIVLPAVDWDQVAATYRAEARAERAILAAKL